MWPLAPFWLSSDRRCYLFGGRWKTEFWGDFRLPFIPLGVVRHCRKLFRHCRALIRHCRTQIRHCRTPIRHCRIRKIVARLLDFSFSVVTRPFLVRFGRSLGQNGVEFSADFESGISFCDFQLFIVYISHYLNLSISQFIYFSILFV